LDAPTQPNKPFVLEFSPEAFYFVLLPPIIFEAGYSMNNRNFFSNTGTIMAYAVIGTLITAFVAGFMLLGFTKAGAVPSLNADHPLECLIWGALISSTDPVATLSIMGAKVDGMVVNTLVYTLVFGEAMLNDATSIVLFRTFDSMVGQEFTGQRIGLAIAQFFVICIGSIVVGVVISLLSALVFKRIEHINEYPVLEMGMCFLFAYMSYLACELVYMSGIIGIFIAGVIMKHYSWYSMSEDARHGSDHIFHVIAFAAENFVFIYLGINLSGYSPDFQWDPGFIFFALISVLIARAFHIFILTFFCNLGRKVKITFKMQIMLWFAGLRGAIAVALAENVRTDHRSVIVSSTLAVVFITTILLGLSTGPMLKKLNLYEPEHMESVADEEEDVETNHGDGNGTVQLEEMTPTAEGAPATPGLQLSAKKKRSKFQIWFKRIDEQHLKPWFGGKPADWDDKHKGVNMSH